MKKPESTEYPFEKGQLYFIRSGRGYAVATQATSPFNDSDVPASDVAQVGHTCGPTFYFPKTDTGRAQAGWTKQEWIAAGDIVYRW